MRAGPEVSLELLDDGPGIPPDAASRGGGITGIRRRVTALGGALEIGPGGRLFVRLPARSPAPDPPSVVGSTAA